MMRFFVFIGMICLFSACVREQYRRIEGKIYGTYYRITYEAKEDFSEKLKAEMEKVNASLSMFNPRSVVARWNRGESEEVDSLFMRMFQAAEKINRETKGAFDITVAPLANAWGFGYKQNRFPLPEEIDSLLQYIGMEKLKIAGCHLLKEKKEMEIDASSIAKGLGVDLVAEFLEGHKVRNYMVDIGGEIRAKGKSDKERPWRIGIDKPIGDVAVSGRELQMIIQFTGGAIATSGNYRNYYIHEGKKYAHTLNPRTGYPVQRDILSSSVYAPTCMEADAYATAFMVLGLEESKKIVENNAEIEVCFVYEQEGENKVWMTEKFKDLVVKEE